MLSTHDCCYHPSRPHRGLHSFPTRRSSDLPFLSAPTISYLRIDDSEGSKLSFPATDEACEQLPFVGLAVVYTADQDSATLHAVRTVGAGFVDCRRAGDRGPFYESMCSHF